MLNFNSHGDGYLNINTLSVNDIVDIHTKLTLDALQSDDPISPPGVKDPDLLESAIARQLTGYGNTLKYDTPVSNAATLCYGICCNHALYNGNKRTALVALFCHLDKNGLTFNDKASQDDLFKFMLKVASHSIIKKNKVKNNITTNISDLEVKAMGDWINKRTRRINKSERMLTYPKLERLLKNHDIFFENNKGNYVDVIQYKTIEVKRGFFSKKEKKRTGEKIANIPYFPGRTVGKTLIKSIRSKAGLTHSQGCDSVLFYGDQRTPDDFITKYKGLLNKLAKT